MVDYCLDAAFLNKAKMGFYPNDGRTRLGEGDFMKAVGVTTTQYAYYLKYGYIYVTHTTYKKLLVLQNSPKHFHALFKVIDIRSS